MIIYQSRIYRADLRANPDAMYIFGDNAERVGMGGQAKEMRGEPNAHGIATKASPGRYFSDTEYEWVCNVIDRDLLAVAQMISQGGNIVFPLDGIGTGLSDMPRQAPRCWSYLVASLEALGIKAVQS